MQEQKQLFPGVSEAEVVRFDARRKHPKCLSNAELIAAMCGIDDDSARAVIRDAGGLAKACGLDRFTPPAHTSLAYAAELIQRAQDEALICGESLRSPEDSGDYVSRRLRHLPYEVFVCVHLDNRHRVLAVDELFRGTIDGASVHPREVARACMQHNTAAVIFAHNHPSGVPEPSAADRSITQTLRDALGAIEVRVLDHLVVGNGAPVSMAARGLI